MQCAGISIIKNEADIIEAFVRHNLKYLNKLYLVAHDPQDNTSEIVRNLKDEGYNLEIYTNTSSRHIQAEEFNRLIRKADSDFIVFLDADEFLVSKDFSASLAVLPKDIVSFIIWHNYVPQPDDSQDKNVLKRIQHRLPIDTNQHKALIPRSIYSKENSFVLLGGHEIYYKQDGGLTPAPYEVIDSIHLAHFPMRSLDQIQVKVYSNWLSKLADPLHKSGRLQDGKIPTWHHWKKLFDLFKNNPDLSEEDAMKAVVKAYMKKELEIIHDPVPTNDEIIYEIKALSPLFALADTAEKQVVKLQKANLFILNLLKEVEEFGAI